MKLKHIYITKEGEPMANPDTNNRDWEEDFPHENGRYFNVCINCNHSFMGHKRRLICAVCSGLLPFEDSQSVWYHPSVYQLMNIEQLEPKDTLIPVDLNIEIVTDKDGRKVLRIKP